MSVKAYKSTATRRIFTNHPFRRGMLYEDITINDDTSKTLANLDIPSSGDYAYPRPAYVNAAIDTFFEVALNFPTTVIKQETSLAKTFLIGFEQTVNEEDYVNGVVNNTQALTRGDVFGLFILQNGKEFQEKERRDGIYEIVNIDDVFDGDTFRFTVLKSGEEHQIVVRLLGIDTPELGSSPEPFADAAREFVIEFLNPHVNTVGDFEILNRYIQYEPATVSTDRTDSERVLAYVIIHLKDSSDNHYYYTLSEMLLKAGLGKAMVGRNYIYYDRHKEADAYAKANDLGVYSIEEPGIEPPVPDWSQLTSPSITPDPLEIQYDSNAIEYYLDFTIGNDTGYYVTLVVELGSFFSSQQLAPGEFSTFSRKIFMDVDYVLRARFLPFDLLDEMNSSDWTEIPLGMITLNLTSMMVEANAPFEMTPVKRGFEYSIQNNMEYPIFFRARYFPTPVNPLTIYQSPESPVYLEVGTQVADTYINEDWPTFETYTKNISVFYQTPYQLGTVRSLSFNKQIEVEGYKPVVSVKSYDLLDVTLEITNNNFFDTEYRIFIDGDAIEDWTAITAETVVEKELTLTQYNTTHNIEVQFRDGSVLSDKSDLITHTTEDIPVYNVTFIDDSDEVIEVQQVELGADATPPTHPYKVGYDPDGWSESYTNITQNTTIKALYVIQTFTVTFMDSYDNSEIIQHTNVEWGSTISPPSDPSHAGYTFTGWSNSEKLDPVTEDVISYAQYDGVSYTVTFKDHDDTVLKTETVDHGSNATAPTNPSRYGHVFSGWDTDFTNVTSNLFVNATYTVNSYVVEYYYNTTGPIQFIESETVNYGDLLTPPTNLPDIEGWEFDEWWPHEPIKAEDGYEGEWWPDASTTLDFVAEYKEIIIYTVTFKDWDGEVLETEDVVSGQSATAPADPTRTGYTFDGWDKAFNNVTEDLTVTAEYSINTYTVTFKDYDDTVLDTETVDHGSDATAPADPTRTGYIFDGWDTDFTNVTEDLTVTAEYVVDNKTPDPTVTLTYSSATNNLSVYIKNNDTGATAAPATVTGNHPFTGIPSTFDAQQVYTESKEAAGISGTSTTYTVTVVMETFGKDASDPVTATRVVNH